MTMKHTTHALLLHFGLFCITAHFSASAQSSQGNTFPRAVKVSVNYVKTFGNGYRLGDVAPALMKKTKKNNFHELELNTFDFENYKTPLYNSLGQPIGHVRYNRQDIGFRYQYTFSFMKKAKLNPQLGLSLLNRYQGTESEPSVTNSYPRRTRQWNGIVAVSPQVRYNISPRLFADLAFPVELADFGFTFQEINNPGIPIRQQRNGGFEYDQLQNWDDRLHIRFGAGLMF
jgi:hypothetical protein